MRVLVGSTVMPVRLRLAELLEGETGDGGEALLAAELGFEVDAAGGDAGDQAGGC